MSEQKSLINPFFIIELNEGLGAVLTEDIYYILPDLKNPKKHSTMFTSATGPITVVGRSDELIAEWYEALGITDDE